MRSSDAYSTGDASSLRESLKSTLGQDVRA